jgi:opacity protein-like surface antigen
MRLAKIGIFFAMIFLVAGLSQAQVILGVQAGYNSSAFEDQESAASTFSGGVILGTDIAPIVDLGLEYNTLFSSFEFDQADGLKAKISQHLIGVWARWYFIPLPTLSPYIRGGVGYYTGKLEVSGTQSGEADFKSTVGFNVGAGVDLPMGLYGEFIYHIVSRELDVAGATSSGFNNWAINVGYSFDLL